MLTHLSSQAMNCFLEMRLLIVVTKLSAILMLTDMDLIRLQNLMTLTRTFSQRKAVAVDHRVSRNQFSRVVTPTLHMVLLNIDMEKPASVSTGIILLSNAK